MGIWNWLTATPEQRRKQALERKQHKRAQAKVHQPINHPDDWGPGYGVNWEWGKATVKGKRK